ncbi:zinc finger BED domain-containing protein RICESLEEPER 2-like [Rhizophagus clarus]|uniref:Zinc finger BED domain-containing protein RICESLEEPER 2-like n=1 Tax=Rhizophagus clarus TaxID=94130 RepID=A0A8H3QHK4_9GLOM|nr:zinc finger BED domain-containing protein RICESLEEPER 2-like [Rhizophagus clarus]
MNIVVQVILKQIKLGEAQIEDFILDNIEEAIPAGEIPYATLHKLIVKVRSSSQRKEKFARQSEAAGLKELNLILGVRTKWNSTYDMLVRALEIREVSISNCAPITSDENLEDIDDIESSFVKQK